MIDVAARSRCDASQQRCHGSGRFAAWRVTNAVRANHSPRSHNASAENPGALASPPATPMD